MSVNRTIVDVSIGTAMIMTGISALGGTQKTVEVIPDDISVKKAKELAEDVNKSIEEDAPSAKEWLAILKKIDDVFVTVDVAFLTAWGEYLSAAVIAYYPDRFLPDRGQVEQLADQVIKELPLTSDNDFLTSGEFLDCGDINVYGDLASDDTTGVVMNFATRRMLRMYGLWRKFVFNELKIDLGLIKLGGDPAQSLQAASGAWADALEYGQMAYQQFLGYWQLVKKAASVLINMPNQQQGVESIDLGEYRADKRDPSIPRPYVLSLRSLVTQNAGVIYNISPELYAYEFDRTNLNQGQVKCIGARYLAPKNVNTGLLKNGAYDKSLNEISSAIKYMVNAAKVDAFAEYWESVKYQITLYIRQIRDFVIELILEVTVPYSPDAKQKGKDHGPKVLGAALIMGGGFFIARGLKA